MKRYKIYILTLICLSALFSACSSDDENFKNQSSLEEAIRTAENLINTTEEGTEEGDFPPGSQERLQGQIDWGKFILETSKRDDAYANATKIILNEIEVYKTNLVKGGYPLYGQGSFFSLGKLADFNINKKFTIECKVRFKDFGSSLGNIIAAEAGPGGIILRNNGDVVDAYINDGGWLGGGASIKLELNKWHHLAFTYSGSKVVLYIDGVVAMSASGNEGEVKADDVVNLQVGANPSYPNRYMNGNVAYVSIWDYPRTAEEVQSDLNPAFTGTENGLIAYWPFDVNLGSSILDKTENYTAKGTLVNWEDK